MNGDLIGACVMIAVAVLWIVGGVARIVLDHLATEHEAARMADARRWSDRDFRARWDAMTEGEREAGLELLLTALREDLPVPWVLSEAPIHDELMAETFRRQLDYSDAPEGWPL